MAGPWNRHCAMQFYRHNFVPYTTYILHTVSITRVPSEALKAQQNADTGHQR